MEVGQLRIQVVQDNLMKQKHIKNNRNRSPRKYINSILTLFFCSPHTFAALVRSEAAAALSGLLVPVLYEQNL